ncbi:uncharacterized protein LOC124934202 [Impatiens glandulifera]|uniref:uncharacterized protein LOC124934202 n=1 Tax=Impatiens glandulifera TaxID=253017 RepID=UPI001FB12E13|nr:uncharacterized protein LOC124934202 [Impatiens glandulifera]
MSSFNSTPNFDNLMLQTLMGKLQIRPPNTQSSSPFSNKTLEDILIDAISNIPDDEENDDEKTELAREESKVEKEIIRTILSGKIETLKPNSGQAISIGEHHICVGYHEEPDSDYRVWEWHGHIMLFDDEDGYTPEYIYGNYFEKQNLKSKPVVENLVDEDDDDDEKLEEIEEKKSNLGLRELIESGDSGSSRILHRNVSAGSSSFK